MSKDRVVATIGVSILTTVAILVGSLLFFSGAMAAPATEKSPAPISQPSAGGASFVSVSSVGFLPVAPENSAYTRDPAGQLLALTGSNANNNLFVAPLSLPDNSSVVRMTVFGQYFDSNGGIQIYLKRCPHNGQTACRRLASAGVNTGSPAQARFETHTTVVPNVIVDNQRFTYMLELELTALENSGLRSVRLELASSEEMEPAALPPGSQAAVVAASTDLAQSTGIPAGQIQPVLVEPKEWPDASLGCPEPGQAAIQVVTPGYLMILEAQGRRYEYHTNQTGSSVVLCSQQ
jgi:hypothetical protein